MFDFDEELKKLNASIISMGKMIEIPIESSVLALMGWDLASCDEIIKNDDAIDEMEKEIEYFVVKPIDPEKKTFKQLYPIAWGHIVTFLFNITCHTPPVQTSQSPLSRNALLLRLRAMSTDVTSNTKLTLCVWRFMRPSKKFLLSNSNNPNFNFLYIQSGQDALADWKVVSKLEKKADPNHYYKMPTGYHILSMEPVESKDLFDIIYKFSRK